MNTNAPQHNPILENLMTCQGCNAPLTATRDDDHLPIYQCGHPARTPLDPGKPRRFHVQTADYDVLSTVAETFIASDITCHRSAPNQSIYKTDPNDILAETSDPAKLKTAVLACAQRPDIYCRPDVVDRTKALLAKVIDHITVAKNDITIFPTPLQVYEPQPMPEPR